MLNQTKYCLTGLLLLSGFASYTQQKVQVSAEISGLKDTLVNFNYYTKGRVESETVRIKEGKFEWNADMTGAQRVGLYFSRGPAFFYAESGVIRITGDADALNVLKVSGSGMHDEYQAYKELLNGMPEKEQAFLKEFRAANPIRKKEIQQEMIAMRLEIIAIEKKYVMSHPESALSVSMIVERSFTGNYEQIAELYQSLSGAMKKTAQGKRIAERLAVLKRSAIGVRVHNFKQSDTSGKMIRFSDVKGKYVLIDFWASWCGPRRAENPNILKVYNQYRNKNFTVVGVSIDHDAGKWKKAIKADQMPWTQLSDLRGLENEVTVYYGIYGIPSTLLVDPAGKIIAKGLRGAALNKKLAELFD